ncbi:MAG: transposase [Treponema sp.]|nr:transposase [Treponema sp.]
MRSNYSREERQKIVEEYIQSGKSQTAFAPEYGIKPNTLSAWVTKYKTAVACQSADVYFVELKSTFIKEKQNLIIRWYNYWNNQNGIALEDYLRCLFEKAPYAETEEDWKKLLPWNIEIAPYKIRGEWI